MYSYMHMLHSMSISLPDIAESSLRGKQNG